MANKKDEVLPAAEAVKPAPAPAKAPEAKPVDETAKVARAVKKLTDVAPEEPLIKVDRVAVEAALEYLVSRADTYDGRVKAVAIIREVLGMPDPTV